MAFISYDDEIRELFEQFYVLTGIRIVLKDENFKRIIAYPDNDKGFCSYLRQFPEFLEKCNESDTKALINCRKSQKITIYKCHAGLTEVAAPIIDNGILMGYIMLGQVTDNKNKDEVTETLVSLCEKYIKGGTIKEKAKRVKYKSSKQMYAAQKILDACISCIILKKMLRLSKSDIFFRIDEYIDRHLSEDIDVETLCREFNISRTSLYELMSSHVSIGIAAFIREKRMNMARNLLETTSMTVTDIAYSVGFKDYNYFLKVFKKHFGLSTKAVRKNAKRQQIINTF